MRKNKSLITIFFIVFIGLFGFGIIMPLLPYIAESFGASPLQIGLLATTYSLFQFIASPILGALSDRYGRKKILIISQIGTTIGFILLGTANSLILIFISRIIDGATGGNISIAQAYIADVTSKKDRARGMGLIGAAFGLGFIFGPAVGGLLSNISFSAPAYLAALISLLTTIATAIFLKETVDVKKSKNLAKTKISFRELGKVFTNRPLRLYLVNFFTISFAFSLMQSIFAIWTEHTYSYTPSQNGFIFAFMGLMTVIVQLKVLPFVIKSFKERKILPFSILILGAGLISIPIFSHPYFLYLSIGLMTLGNGIAGPVFQSMASKKVDKEDYGETLGVLQSSGSLGRIIGPALGGILFSSISKDAPFILAGISLFFLALGTRKKLQ